VDDLLAAVRRRLRWTWTVATLHWVGPAVALVALGVVLVGRLVPWAWPERTALAVPVLVVVAVVVVARAVRIPDIVAARSADRGLGTHDALAAALEVGDTPGALPERVRARAASVASGASARAAVPAPRARRRLAVTGLASVCTIGLAWLPNPQDEVRRERALEQAALEAEADDLREAAAALEERPGAGEAERALAEELRALADELDEAGSIDEAQEALADARAELQAQVPTDFLAQRAAATGLDRSLEAAPLPGTAGASAAEQLEELAGALSGMSPADQAAVAQRLSELADTQAVGDPAAAEALDAAAAAITAGDVAGAEAALGEAASAQAAAVDAAAAGASAQAAVGAVDAASADVESGRSGEAAQQSAAPGQGQGEGEGDGSGQGDGPGSGQGSGQGSGSGGSGGGAGAGGNAAGNVGAGGTRSGTGSGQGGAGQASGGTSGDGGPAGDEQGTGEVLVYDPTYTEGDQLDAGGSVTGGRPGETVGRGPGATGSGQVQVPLSQVIADYQRRASEALGRGDLPPSSADLVRAYFDAIAGFGD
jgi:hypothetical protein